MYFYNEAVTTRYKKKKLNYCLFPFINICSRNQVNDMQFGICTHFIVNNLEKTHQKCLQNEEVDNLAQNIIFNPV